MSMGPLSVNQQNTRYFEDGIGNIVYLSGFHNWELIQDWGDRPDFDFNEYIQFLKSYNMNLTRSWVWFHTWRDTLTVSRPLEPYIYKRTGPGLANDGFLKTDLTQFNEDYFTRLRQRIIELRDNGIYIAVMLFNGTSFTSTTRWTSNVFNIDNNINGIGGDLNNNGSGIEIYDYNKLITDARLQGVLKIHEDYIRKVIDTLNDLDNVIWDIGNSLYSSSIEFINYFIDFIRDYEATKRKQHMIGFNALGDISTNTDLFASTADWVSPYKSLQPMHWDFAENPPVNDGNKVVISDSDNLSGIILTSSPGIYRKWAWKTFTRGHQPLVMDIYPGDNVGWIKNPNRHDAIYMAANTCRYIKQYADRLDLRNLIPTESISSTEYCIYDSGKQYLIYQPNDSQNFTVNLDKGTYQYEMFNPTTGSIADSGKITVESGIQNFTYNFYGDAVLFLSSVDDPCEGVVCENICLGADLYSQKCVDGFCVTDQLIERNSVNCVSDPCEGVVCENICLGADLYSQKCVDGFCVTDQLIERNSVNCGYDPCEGVVCENICLGADLYSQKCVDGFCVTDQLIERNSVNCGYDPCEGVVCENICLGADLYSQKCVDGFCVTDQLIERNSVNCVSDPCAGVVCSNTCVGDDLWSRRCDPATGQCVLDQLIQSDSINCKIPDVIPSDDSTINTYLILGGLGIVALSVLIASKKEADQS